MQGRRARRPRQPGRRNYGRRRPEGPHLPPLKMPWKGRRERRARTGRRKPAARRIAFWLGVASSAGSSISFLAFAISAQLQSFKLAGEAKDAAARQPVPLAQRPDHPRDRHRRASARHQGTDRAALARSASNSRNKGDAPHAPLLRRRIPRRHPDADPGRAAAPSTNSRSRATATPKSPASSRRKSTPPSPSAGRRCRSRRSKSSSASRSTTSRSSTSPASKT